MGPYFGQYGAISGNIGAISDDIGQYQAISGDIWVISSSVKSVMYLARPIQVVPGQLIFLLILSGRVGYVALNIAQNGRYRTISLTLRVILHISAL